MVNKLILATIVLMLTISLSIALDPQGTQEPGIGPANPDIKEAAQATGQNQTANDSLFLEDFNRVNNPYKETLFATGQGQQKRIHQLLRKSYGCLDSFPGEV